MRKGIAVCRSNKLKCVERSKKQIKVEQVNLEHDDVDFIRREIVLAKHNDWLILLNICNKVMYCSIDAGAETNVIGKSCYNTLLSPPPLQRTVVQLTVYYLVVDQR